MAIRISIASVLLVGLLALVGTVHADVVELANGNRVEGDLRQVDQKTVVIEVGGQALTLEREKVRAIFLGKAPEKASQQAASPGASQEALRALQGVRSMVASGPQLPTTVEWLMTGAKLPVSYVQYEPRVIDAKIIVDRYLQEGGGDAGAKKFISDSTYFYVLAGTAMSRNEEPTTAVRNLGNGNRSR